MQELTTPCMSTAVDGAARGILLGIAWGAVFDIPPLGFIAETPTSPSHSMTARRGVIGGAGHPQSVTVFAEK